MSQYCDKCDSYIFSYETFHYCPPLWEACDPEMDADSWVEIYASDPEEAACDYCKMSDIRSADYTYARRGEATILVRAKADPKVTHTVLVTVETDPVYSGRAQ